MRIAVAGDAKAVAALTCRCFGDAYTTEEEISGFISCDENRLYVQYDEQGLAGAILFLEEDRQKMTENLSIAPADYDRTPFLSGYFQAPHPASVSSSLFLSNHPVLR